MTNHVWATYLGFEPRTSVIGENIVYIILVYYKIYIILYNIYMTNPFAAPYLGFEPRTSAIGDNIVYIILYIL